MYIKIKKYQEGISKGIETSVFGKNTEDLVIKLIGAEIVNLENRKNGKKHSELRFSIQAFNLNKLINTGGKYSNGELLEFNENIQGIVIPEDFNLNMISGIKRLALEIKTIFGLNSSDYEIIAEPEWQHKNMNIRVTISDKKLKEPPFKKGVPSYAELVSHVLSLGVPYYEYGDLNVIYFTSIAEDHKFIYDDPDILIEEQ